METIDKIKSIPTGQGNRNSLLNNDEKIAIAKAWIKGEIRNVQIMKSVGLTGSNIYNVMAIGLRLAYQKGYLIFKNEKTEIKTEKN